MTIRQYRQESMSGDYSHLLATAMNYCEVGRHFIET